MSRPIIQSADSVPIVRHPLRSPLGQLWHPRMVAYYSFEGGGIDASGNGRTATKRGPSLTSPSGWPFGVVSSHDGTDDDWLITHHASLSVGSSGFTAGIWFQTSLVDNRTMFQKGTGTNQWRIHVDGSGNLRLGINDGTGRFITNAVSVVDGKWHHAAMTVELGGLVRGYLDGAQFGTTAAGSNGTSDTTDLNIGSISGAGGSATGYWSGLLDEAVIFDAVLSADDITRLTKGFPPESI